jgi:8-oxo-dGTP diphosphatase
MFKDIYKGNPKHYVAVDCVIFGYEEDKLKLLLHPRPLEPSKGGWSLMGGFCNEDESLELAAKRVLKKTTGLENIFLEQVQAFSEIERDPGFRVISVAFYALIPLYQQDGGKARARRAKWFSLEHRPALIFDHENMVQLAMKKLQMRASYQLVGKELLSEMFTLTQLRRLYEAIFQRYLDPGNFRKKVLSLKALDRLNEKDTTESKKGAYLYQFKDNPTVNNDRIFKVDFSI